MTVGDNLIANLSESILTEPVDAQRPSIVDPAQLIRIEATHRGFLYQHLYVARSLLLATGTDVTRVLVEGDEDVEIFRPKRRIYIQVKVRAVSLGWSDVKDALDRFAIYRALHESGEREGEAVFVVASSAPPKSSLLKHMQSDSWPKDVLVNWPDGPISDEALTPNPPGNVLGMFDACRDLAAELPFALLTPETLVWKLAGQITLAAAGQPPRTDHAFHVSELPEIFEQLVIQLQDFPSPPLIYRTQQVEPAFLDEKSIRLIIGYSGAGKTSWVAQAAVHAAGVAIYFDVRDIPGGGLAAGLAREVAARKFGRMGGLGRVLLPGASGLETLQSLSRETIAKGETLTVVLDNVHRPPAADVQALVRAAPGFRFVLLGQPGPECQELAALLQISGETLGGWSSDTIAAEAAAHGCRVDAATCQSLLEQTGGLPLYVQNAISIAASEHNGSLDDLCRQLAQQSHSVETTQEIILSRVIEVLPEETGKILATLSISDIPLSREEVTQFVTEALKIPEAGVATHLRRLRTAGVLEIFGDGKLKLHDAVRLLGRGRLAELGQESVGSAQRALRDVLSKSLESNWEYRKLALYLLMLAEAGDIKTLVQYGTDELFHELGLWPVIEPYLVSAAAAEDLNPEERFWALDGIVFNELRIGEESNTAAHIALMKQLVVGHDLGAEERLAVGMKEMSALARARDAVGVRQVMTAVAAELRDTPAHRRIFRYNAAVSMFFLGEFEIAESEVADLVNEYYDVIGLTPQIVLGRNAPELRPLLRQSPDLTDNLKHLADSLDLYAKAMTAQGKVSPFARIHALKFYDLARSPESQFRVGQDLVDEFVLRNDFVGARQIIETNLLPMLQQLKLASYVIPVRSQYAVVLAYCGDFGRAEAEMARLTPYEPGLSPRGQRELRDQRRLIFEIKQRGPPPQFRMPTEFPKSLGAFRQSISVKKVGRNEPCPCGSGLKFKKCHG